MRTKASRSAATFARVFARIPLLLAFALLLAAPGSGQAAVTFGSDLTAAGLPDDGCEIGTCTRMLELLGGRTVGSPIDGVVVRWRAEGKGTLRLRAIRRTGP